MGPQEEPWNLIAEHHPHRPAMLYLPRHPIAIAPCAVAGGIDAEIDTKDNTKENTDEENTDGFSIKVTGYGAHWPIG